jgi:outer membrane protein assembly factor BamD (BamD/ComL family)
MRKYQFIFFALFALGPLSVKATHLVNSVHQESRIEQREKLPTMTAKEHFASMEQAFVGKDWGGVLQHAKIIEENFSEEIDLDQVAYFTGVANYHKQNLVEANAQLSQSLSNAYGPYFIEALRYKFDIAKSFAKGSTGNYPVAKRLFSERSFKERAIEIFEEIILAEPSGDLAVYSLYHKALILLDNKMYDQAVEAFDILIRDFFKHELVPRAYVGISKAYADRYQEEKAKDVALLDLAELNVKKFKLAYPGHELVAEAKKELQKMREAYAYEMYHVGEYFERRGKSRAAGFYFRDICENFSDCEAAKLCKQYKNAHLDASES